MFEFGLAIADALIGLVSIAVPWGIADPQPGSNNYADDQLAMKLGVGFGLPFLLAAACLVTRRRPSLVAAAVVGLAAGFAAYVAIGLDLYFVCFVFGTTSAAMLSIRNRARLSEAEEVRGPQASANRESAEPAAEGDRELLAHTWIESFPTRRASTASG